MKVGDRVTREAVLRTENPTGIVTGKQFEEDEPPEEILEFDKEEDIV